MCSRVRWAGFVSTLIQEPSWLREPKLSVEERRHPIGGAAGLPQPHKPFLFNVFMLKRCHSKSSAFGSVNREACEGPAVAKMRSPPSFCPAVCALPFCSPEPFCASTQWLVQSTPINTKSTGSAKNFQLNKKQKKSSVIISQHVSLLDFAQNLDCQHQFKHSTWIALIVDLLLKLKPEASTRKLLTRRCAQQRRLRT